MPSRSAEDEVRKLLSPLRDGVPEPSPFLKTRVLAELREQRRQRSVRSVWALWKPALGFSAAAALMLVLWTGREARGPVFPATAGQPVAVKVDMKEWGGQKVASAKVELPRGVRFYSRSFPAIEQKSTLDLAWKEDGAPGALPIVVKADENGLKTVRVKFFDEGKKLVGERLLKIRFEQVDQG
ncbi:MAG: hypothetical protein NDJ90_01920 [Oligoflexia bacterium]|nr:hypothetical protein [Oligoflexia bacterium]